MGWEMPHTYLEKKGLQGWVVLGEQLRVAQLRVTLGGLWVLRALWGLGSEVPGCGWSLATGIGPWGVLSAEVHGCGCWDLCL